MNCLADVNLMKRHLRRIRWSSPAALTATAWNYDADATDDDGSCDYDNAVRGLHDSAACNFEPAAT